MQYLTITLTDEDYARYCEVRHALRIEEKQAIAKRATLREMKRLERKLQKQNGSKDAGPAQRLGGGPKGASNDAGRAQPAKKAS